MLPVVIVHRSDISFEGGRGCKDKKVSIIGVLEKKLGPTTDKDGMDALSMEMLTVVWMCFSMSSP